MDPAWGPVGWESGCLMETPEAFGASELAPKVLLWSLACKELELLSLIVQISTEFPCVLTLALL